MAKRKREGNKDSNTKKTQICVVPLIKGNTKDKESYQKKRKRQIRNESGEKYEKSVKSAL